MGVADCIRVRGDGIELFVRLTPKSAYDRLDGVEGSADGTSHIKARVRALPQEGAANMALEKLIAGRLGVRKSDVSVIAGSTSRLKTVRILGDPASLSAMIEHIIAQAGHTGKS